MSRCSNPPSRSASTKLPSIFTSGERQRRLGQDHRTVTPYEVFQTADGWIVIGVATEPLWQ